MSQFLLNCSSSDRNETITKGTQPRNGKKRNKET